MLGHQKLFREPETNNLVASVVVQSIGVPIGLPLLLPQAVSTAIAQVSKRVLLMLRLQN